MTGVHEAIRRRHPDRTRRLTSARTTCAVAVARSSAGRAPGCGPGGRGRVPVAHLDAGCLVGRSSRSRVALRSALGWLQRLDVCSPSVVGLLPSAFVRGRMPRVGIIDTLAAGEGQLHRGLRSASVGTGDTNATDCDGRTIDRPSESGVAGVAVIVFVLLGALVMAAAVGGGGRPVARSRARTRSTRQMALSPDGSTTVVWSRSDGFHYIAQAVKSRGRRDTRGRAQPLSAGGGRVQPTCGGRHRREAHRHVGALRRVEPNRASGAAVGGGRDARHGTRPLNSSPRHAELAARGRPDGTATVTWDSSNGANRIVHVMRLSAADGTPGTVRDLSAVNGDAEQAQVAVAADGTATVTWQRSSGTDLIVQAVRLSADGTPGAVHTLSAAGRTSQQPQVAVGADGTPTVTWYGWNAEGTYHVVEAVRLSAADGTPGTMSDVSPAGQDSQSPQVAVAPDGTPTVTWNSFDGTHFTVHAVRLSALDGTPATVHDLSAAGADSYGQQVALAADGTATVTWNSWNEATHNYEVHAVRLSATDGTPGTVSDLSAVGEQPVRPARGDRRRRHNCRRVAELWRDEHHRADAAPGATGLHGAGDDRRRAVVLSVGTCACDAVGDRRGWSGRPGDQVPDRLGGRRRRSRAGL